MHSNQICFSIEFPDLNVAPQIKAFVFKHPAQKSSITLKTYSKQIFYTRNDAFYTDYFLFFSNYCCSHKQHIFLYAYNIILRKTKIPK